MVKWMVLIVVIFLVVFFVVRAQELSKQYRIEAKEGIERTRNIEAQKITEKDIAHLPEPVQRYLRYVSVIGKEKVKNFRLSIDGEMKMDRDKDWAKVDVGQYSFSDDFTRLFFMRMKMFGISVIGLHSYHHTNATMQVKVLGLLPVVDGKGPEMDKGETVTLLNDMCIFAPATLIDDRLEWESIDDTTAKVALHNEDIEVAAMLYFNQEGQLINFVSEDRYYSTTGETYEQVRWSTPISRYKNFNGYNLPAYGEAVWNFPEEDYSYIRLNIKDVEYNVENFRE